MPLSLSVQFDAVWLQWSTMMARCGLRCLPETARGVPNWRWRPRQRLNTSADYPYRGVNPAETVADNVADNDARQRNGRSQRRGHKKGRGRQPSLICPDRPPTRPLSGVWQRDADKSGWQRTSLRKRRPTENQGPGWRHSHDHASTARNGSGRHSDRGCAASATSAAQGKRLANLRFTIKIPIAIYTAVEVLKQR